MVQYLYGNDTYGAREYIRNLAAKQNAQLVWIDRQQAEEQTLSHILSQGNAGLFGRNLYVVRDPSAWPKRLQEDVEASVQTYEQSDWVVWDRVAPDKRSTLFKQVRSCATEFPALSSDELSAWIQAIAQESGGTCDRAAAFELIRLVGDDRWKLKNEVERLLLAHPTVTQEVIQEALPSVQAETTVFLMLDAMIRKNTARALESLETLLHQGESEFYILSMLAYQFRTLGFIRSGMDEGLSQGEIAKRYELKPFVVQKNMPVAKHLSLRDIATILARIAATDFTIKQGNADARTAVIMLVTALSR